jgi:hypothetical protein
VEKESLAAIFGGEDSSISTGAERLLRAGNLVACDRDPFGYQGPAGAYRFLGQSMLEIHVARHQTYDDDAP